MRIGIFEWVCGGGQAHVPIDQIPKSLRAEGMAMLASILQDLTLVPDIEVSGPADRRLLGTGGPFGRLQSLDPGLPCLDQWTRLASNCDAVILIAPELDGQLIQAAARLRETGSLVLTPDAQFLQAASDKWACHQAWSCDQLRTPWTCRAEDWMANQHYWIPNHQGWVVKPRDGAGCQGIAWYPDHGQATLAIGDLVLEDRSNLLVQSMVPGRSASVVVLAGPKDLVALPPCHQDVVRVKSADLACDRFEYRGGSCPWLEHQSAIQRAAIQWTRALPGKPLGWIGLDLVWHHAAGAVAIEVNPRWTTSYLGLRQIAQSNLAWDCIQIALGQRVEPDFDLKKRVAFSVHGTSYELDSGMHQRP
jgi:hypothetical protein